MNGIARIAAITLAMAAPAAADPLPPSDATALMPEAALACAAARYAGEVLRIDAREGGRIQELRWLTPQRNVLDIRLTGPGCRFLEVRGVGQIEARILPGAGP
jgi:hypothetical protein